MKPWEWSWFQQFISWLRVKSPWFDTWGYGYSKDLEDFCRNPFERLRDERFPFCIKDVAPKVFLFRYRFIPFKTEYVAEYNSIPNTIPSTFHKIYPAPAFEKVCESGKMATSLIHDKWITKYPNATFMVQLILSLKWGWLPIPFVSCNLRINELKYWQFGLGWGPQWANYDKKHPGEEYKTNAVLCGKFRYVNYKDESVFNPSDVYGYYEGDV